MTPFKELQFSFEVTIINCPTMFVLWSFTHLNVNLHAWHIGFLLKINGSHLLEVLDGMVYNLLFSLFYQKLLSLCILSNIVSHNVSL